MTEEARKESERNIERRDSGVFLQSDARANAPRPSPDRARVLLCVLGMRDRSTERSVSRALDGLPWTASARELVHRLLRSDEPEAGARAALALARGEGATAFADVMQQIKRRLDAEPAMDAWEARMLGAALAAADRRRAVTVVRIQVANASTEAIREVWRGIGVAVSKESPIGPDDVR